MAKIIPGLRPWEVLSVEQAMDQITYGGEWFREPLGTFTTGPPYIREWNKDVMVRAVAKFFILNLILHLLVHVQYYSYVNVATILTPSCSAFFMQRLFQIFYSLSVQVYNKLERTIPGFSTVMEKVQADSIARQNRRKAKRTAQMRAEEGAALFGRVESDK